jgi:pimeloyl-ACP methyl ester carboxylesterase
MKVAFVLVAALLLGACQADKLVTKWIDDPRPTSVNPIATPKGPQATKGAVLFINGVDYADRRTHHIDEDTPHILNWFSFAGFDVYRLDLSPKDQDRYNLIFDAMDRAISDMRRQSYRQVYVVGQSVGGVAALVSTLLRPIQSDGAVAFAAGGGKRARTCGVQPSLPSPIHKSSPAQQARGCFSLSKRRDFWALAKRSDRDFIR